MPTYRVTTVSGSLSDAARARLASEITRVHAQATGALPALVQVVYEEIAPGGLYIKGTAVSADHLFVFATIRAGRPESVVERIFEGIRASASEIAGIDPLDVWIYIEELHHTRMMEYGRLLPEPGQEAAWAAEAPSTGSG